MAGNVKWIIWTDACETRFIGDLPFSHILRKKKVIPKKLGLDKIGDLFFWLENGYWKKHIYRVYVYKEKEKNRLIAKREIVDNKMPAKESGIRFEYLIDNGFQAEWVSQWVLENKSKTSHGVKTFDTHITATSMDFALDAAKEKLKSTSYGSIVIELEKY